MRNPLKSLIAGVATLAITGVMLAAGATAASAAASPYDPDPNAFGTLTFFDAAGQVITSGNGSAATEPYYALASADPTTPVAIKKAQWYGYLPVAGVDPGLWSVQQMSATITYPIASAPATVRATGFPAGRKTATDLTFLTLAQNYPQVTTGAYANLYQIRLVNANGNDYASASVTINQTTGAWQQVYPVPDNSVATTTMLAVTPASPAVAPASPTLTATVAPTAAGSVQFLDGATALGTPVAVAAGVATKALSSVPAATHSYTAVFTPSDAAAFKPSTSAATSYLVNAPLPTPTVALTVDNAAPMVGDQINFTANLNSTTFSGNVTFFDGTTSLGDASVVGDGTAFLDSPMLTLGTHSITAVFVPNNTAVANGATSGIVVVRVSAVPVGACAQIAGMDTCTDAQAFTVVVPAGSLVISTPFHAGGTEFDLGTMTLNSDATELSTQPVSFAGQDPAHHGITITDGRSGLGWSANLQSGDFMSGTAANTLRTNVIDPKYLGFTEVVGDYLPNNALQLNDVAFSQNAGYGLTALSNTGLATSKVFATAAAPGAGSVYVNGNFTLKAPTSTIPGTYLGTVTFTIS